MKKKTRKLNRRGAVEVLQNSDRLLNGLWVACVQFPHLTLENFLAPCYELGS
jgi:hypothetical protein